MKRTLATISLSLAAAAVIAPSGVAATRLSQTFDLHKAAQRGASVLDIGTVHGGPLGPGTVRFTSIAHPDGTVSFAFRELLGHGSVSGEGRLSYRFAAGHTKVLYRGSGHFIRGTGRDTRVAGAFGLTGTGYPNATTTISISAA